MTRKHLVLLISGRCYTAVLCLCTGVLLSGAAAPAQDSQENTDDSQAISNGNSGYVQLISGERLDCTVESINSDGEILGPGVVEGLKLDQISAIQTNRSPGVGQQLPFEVHLIGGGIVNASAAVLKNELLSIQAGFGQISLSSDALVAIVYQRSGDPEQINRLIQNRSPDNDHVIAKSSAGNQTVSGLLEEISADKVHVNYEGTSRTISLDKIVALTVADLKLEPPSGTVSTLVMADGSRLAGRIILLADDVVKLLLVEGAQIEIPWSQVTSVQVRSDRVVYLSDLTPEEVEARPILTYPLTWRRDLSVGGNPMCLRMNDQGNMQTFGKGIGVHAAHRIVFRTGDDRDKLMATVGIDCETQGKGDCIVRVLTDGVESWRKRIRGDDPAVELNVDIANVSSISLEVLAGDEFDLADHVNWADARLIRTAD